MKWLNEIDINIPHIGRGEVPPVNKHLYARIPQAPIGMVVPPALINADGVPEGIIIQMWGQQSLNVTVKY
jgi:hypothetical protein